MTFTTIMRLVHTGMIWLQDLCPESKAGRLTRKWHVSSQTQLKNQVSKIVSSIVLSNFVSKETLIFFGSDKVLKNIDFSLRIKSINIYY